MATDENRKAYANPTKKFFVNMITRDITVEDSILDLLDNSIDSAWQSAGSGPMSLADDTDLSAYSISITISSEQFTIKDNCGGMTFDDAVDYAFSFGRKDSQPLAEYSIGVYGIGMKRAVFKLGRNIRIRSTVAETSDSPSAFAVPISVANWLREDDLPSWDFDIEDDERLDENGVEIIVQELTPGAQASFENPRFIEDLQRMIALNYLLYLRRGLHIFVNDRAVTGLPIELRKSDEIVPMRTKYDEEQNGEKVLVEIIGGMAAPPPESMDPNETSERPWGWYVACNGRIVLGADRSIVSGWGTGDWPQWHSQYNGFIGITFFSAPNTTALPLTTTKRNVDVTSEIFRRARLRMRDLSKQWVAYTNERKQALEVAKAKEAEATAILIQDVEDRPSVILPRLVKKQTERQANVHYSVPISRLKKLADEFGNITMPYRDVGLKSFNYAYEDLVGDE